MDKLVSFVVPIFNVEKYLHKCIDSIINQTYKNIEIILVDDGSPDNSGKICDEYAKNDSRIKVLHKQNEGVSAARNDGIIIASGEYITFIDSDDFISVDYCEKLLNTMIENNAQIIISKMYSFRENEEIKVEEKEFIAETFTSEQTILNLFVKRYYNSMGGKMILKDLFKNIRFPVGRIYEDSATMYKLFIEAKMVVELNQEYYFYLRQREGSTMTSTYNEKGQLNDYLLITERFEYLKEKLPQINEEITSSYIRDIMKVTQSEYITKNENLINSELLVKLHTQLEGLLNSVDKNVLNSILSTYELSCLYLFLQNKEIYEKTIEELYLTRI